MTRRGSPPVILIDMAGRRGWAAVAVAAVALAACPGGWWYLSRPRIEPGSRFAAAGDLRLVDGGTEPSHYEIDATGTGTVWLTVRNAGRVPVTLTGVDRIGDAASSPVAAARLGGAPAAGDVPPAVLGTGPVRVPPDEEAYVALTVQAPPCVAMSEGTALIVESVRLRITSLGRDGTATTPLRLTMHYRKAHPKPPTCP